MDPAVVGGALLLLHEMVNHPEDHPEDDAAEETHGRPRRLHLRREALTGSEASAWQHIKPRDMADTQIQAFTGLSWRAFDRVQGIFSRLWERRYPRRHHPAGRPRVFDSEDTQALCLHYLRSGVRQKILAYIFGATEGVISGYLDNGLRDLVAVLMSIPEASIHWYSVDDLVLINEVACQRARGPRLRQALCDLKALGHVVVGVVDGFNVYAAQSGDAHVQERNYSGYEGTVVASNVLFTALDGCVMAAHLNYEGSAGDSSCAATTLLAIRDNQDNMLPPPLVILADVGFPHSGPYGGKILTPLSTLAHRQAQALLANPATAEDGEGYLFRARATTTIRQSAEWVNADLSQAWQILQRGRLPVDGERCQLILSATAMLHNLRVRVMRLGHVHTTFMGRG